MQRQTLPNTDLTVSALCYGSAGFGTAVKGEELATLINTFRDAGGNFFDTAHCYAFWAPGGDGASERALGEYFRKYGGRDEVVIATKGGHPGREGYRTVEWYLSPGRVGADIDDSLARLGADALDLFLLHRDDIRLPVGEIVEMLNAEIRRGRLRHIGASNWTWQRLAEANQYAAEHGLQGFVITEPEWSLAYRNMPNETGGPSGSDLLHTPGPGDVAWYAANHFPVMPYSSTARGHFATAGQSAKEAFDNDVTRGRVQRAGALAKELGRSANQVALAWLLGHPFPVFPILGTTRLEHLKDALAAAEIRLTPQQVDWLSEG